MLLNWFKTRKRLVRRIAKLSKDNEELNRQVNCYYEQLRKLRKE